MALGRAEERLRHDVQLKVDPEVDEQETVAVLATEETEHEGLGSEYGAVDPAGAAGRHERLVLAAQAQEVAVQRHGLVVGLGLAPVELAGRERPRVVGSANDGLQLRGAQARELGDLLAAPLVDQLGQLALEAGEVEEG